MNKPRYAVLVLYLDGNNHSSVAGRDDLLLDPIFSCHLLYESDGAGRQLIVECTHRLDSRRDRNVIDPGRRRRTCRRIRRSIVDDTRCSAQAPTAGNGLIEIKRAARRIRNVLDRSASGYCPTRNTDL